MPPKGIDLAVFGQMSWFVLNLHLQLEGHVLASEPAQERDTLMGRCGAMSGLLSGCAMPPTLNRGGSY